MNYKLFKRNLTKAILFITCIGCNNSHNDAGTIIDTSKNSKEKFQKVLEYFYHKKDTLGVESAKFLIKNIDGLRTTNSGNTIQDINSLSVEYLISNINLSLKTSRRLLSSKEISFNDFCEYILPYRLGEEKLISWREKCLKRYSKLLRLVEDKNSEKALFIVNTGLSKRFSFDYKCLSAKYYNWDQLDSSMKGDCWTMNTTSLYPLRAISIPVTIDFSPSWGNTNGGSHSWNVLVDSNKSYPFMGCESNSFGYNPLNIYRQKRVPPKVFRKVFSANISIASVLDSDTDHLFPYIQNTRIIDVTNLYVPTLDVRISNKLFRGNKMAFLCTYSRGNWKPIFWGKIKDNTCVFKKMATGVLYMACIRSKYGIQPIGVPFFLLKRGNLAVNLKADINKSKLLSLKISYTQSKELDEQSVYNLPLSGDAFFRTMDSVNVDLKRSQPLDHRRYTLLYYNNGWKLHSTITKLPQKPLVFELVPNNSVYKILSENSTGDERLFSFLDGKQIWW